MHHHRVEANEVSLLGGARRELRKVVWPERAELVTYSAVVLAAVLALTAVIFALDTAFGDGILRLLGAS